METSSPNHLAPETTADAVRRLIIEGEVALVEELRSKALMYSGLAECLAQARAMVEAGFVDRAVEHLPTASDILEDWWIEDSIAVQEHGELLSEQVS